MPEIDLHGSMALRHCHRIASALQEALIEHLGRVLWDFERIFGSKVLILRLEVRDHSLQVTVIGRG